MAFPLRRYTAFLKDGVWSKILLFSFTFFLIRMADAIISFWAPNQIQSSLGSPILMGLIISFQSVVGFIADLTFPTILRSANVRRLIFLGILVSGITSLLLLSATFKPLILVFLITMAAWGIYYELVSFAGYQFMGSFVPLAMRPAAWGVEGIFVNLAYFFGPLLAAYLLVRGNYLAEGVILILLLTAFIIHSGSRSIHESPLKVDLMEINPWVELKHWLTLTEHIWPAMVVSILLGFIDSTFWTTGAIWTAKLSQTSVWGGFFLPLYQLPAIVIGLLIAKWGIYKGKKILAEKMLIAAGIFMIALAASPGVFWQLAMVTLASSALAVCYPLIQGVYSDIVARMGREKKEMIGLTSSSANMAYIVWPVMAGIVASKVGERLTFSVVGGLTVIVAVILLFVTPKKLRLPQSEIKTWE